MYACGLIEEINIEPEQDAADPSKINVRVVVEEVKPRSVELDLDWAFATKNGVPQLSRQALIPGAPARRRRCCPPAAHPYTHSSLSLPLCPLLRPSLPSTSQTLSLCTSAQAARWR